MGDSFRDAAWDNQLDNMLDDLQSSVSSRGETHGYKNGYHNGTNGHTSREYQVTRETCHLPLHCIYVNTNNSEYFVSRRGRTGTLARSVRR